MPAVDTERFRLRSFVERLVQLGECEVHDKPIELAVRRDEVHIPTVIAAVMLDATTGYIKLGDQGFDARRNSRAFADDVCAVAAGADRADRDGRGVAWRFCPSERIVRDRREPGRCVRLG